MLAIWANTPKQNCRTHLATTSWYFQPNSCPRRPTVQYLRPGFNRRTRRACGTTMRFRWSYGGGIPSKVFRRSMAALPRAVLCGIMPRTVRQNILDGARKWKGPVGIASAPVLVLHDLMPQISKLEGYKLTTAGWVESSLLAHESLVLYYFHQLAIAHPFSLSLLRLDSSWGSVLDRLNVRFARKNSPEMLRASHLTTTIFWPLRSCLATVLARRPRRCPLPSMMVCENND